MTPIDFFKMSGSGNDFVIIDNRDEVINGDNINDLVIAYEPVWAIGTGRAATGEQANETTGLIRQNVSRLYNSKIAEEIRILYGGSVTGANTAEFMQQSEIDGALVGGASLKSSEFLSIVTQTSAIKGHY